ncbi:MAG: FHA domain-containing protein [Sandaracinaceae bacterium]|nr:FHA domain-containing protein [Sandaracinaceae bacterium]
MKLYLEYREGSVQVPIGETVIGRNVGCALRFNDPFVSRRHVRILFGPDGAFVEELASRNGTWLNGAPLEGRQPLAHGDTIQLGRRKLQVHLVEDDAPDLAVETTRPDAPGLAAEVLGAEDALSEIEAPRTEPAPPPARTCPRCRARVAAADAHCTTCGYTFHLGRPGALTQQLPMEEVDRELEQAVRDDDLGDEDRRSADRLALAVPVVYTSETMTIDALTYDLSRTGVFIASSLLDEVGTRCQVTLLPEAAPAIPIPAVVARVSADGEPGMGVRFDRPSERALRWLEAVLERAEG